MAIRAILLCIATCTIATGAPPAEDTNEDNVCSSTECLSVASSLLKTIDPKVDPCENFYEFTCGSFLKSKPVNINLQYNQILENKMRADIKQLIEAAIEPDEPKPFQLVKKLHKSCVNTVAIEAKGLQPLRKYLRSLGGWPVVEGDSWKGKNFDWRRTIYRLRRDGHDNEYYVGDEVDCLVRFVIERDERHSSKRIMALRHPLGLLPRTTNDEDVVRNKSLLRTYYESVVDMAAKLGANINHARSEIREMLSFEIELARARSPISKDKEPPQYNPMSIARLKEKYPSVPWMTHVRKFVRSRINLTDQETINVPDPNYYVKLEALMSTTAMRVHANYVMSRIASKNAILASEEMTKIAHRILATRSDFFAIKNRSSYCAAEVTAHLWQGVTAMYANKFLDEETRDTADAVVTNLKRQLDRTLRAYNWPSEEAREAALDKAADLVVRVGYPDSVLDHSKLEVVYGNLEFTEDDYFGNMKNLSNHEHESTIDELEEPLPELDEWGNLRSPTTMNSLYYALENSIHVSAGYLRGLFFGKDRPEYMNYGALGSSVGHEMTHALFENGLYRGSNGTVANYLGLGKRPEFISIARCLINKYGSYHVGDNGIKLDGRKTLSENLADAGGIRLAYEAYESWAAKRDEEPKLPALARYSAKQMFWISSASIWCRKIKPKRIAHEIHTRKHTIEEFRVIDQPGGHDQVHRWVPHVQRSFTKLFITSLVIYIFNEI